MCVCVCVLSVCLATCLCTEVMVDKAKVQEAESRASELEQRVSLILFGTFLVSQCTFTV